MVTEGEEERGHRGKINKKIKAYGTQLPEKTAVNRQVKTRLYLPTHSSYHTIYLSDFPTRKTKVATPL